MGDDPSYFALMLRLWKGKKEGTSEWHASLEDPHTGEQKGFASLKDLNAYLVKITKSRHPVNREEELNP
ncbi:MAG: hypothetical protein ACYC6H_04055 [Bellilinea sp.]